jgi:hypothetical protein
MIGYLNECSLEAHGDWEVSLRFFLEAALELSGAGASLFRDSSFFLNAEFKRRFNSLSLPGDQRGLIRALVFGERYYHCWRPERISTDSDIYTCHGPEGQHLDNSMCEAAERKIQDDTSMVSLLSAADSEFRDQELVSISKDSTGQRIELRGVSSLPTLKKWITEQRGYYDPNSETAPRDFQTVLEKSPDRFLATGMFERKFSRRVFEEIETGRLFHVDEGHPGHSAHLEVYSSRKEHLGTADINTGTLNVSKKRAGRTLKL